MQITEKAWLEYITKMSQISQKAADLMQAYVQKHGLRMIRLFWIMLLHYHSVTDRLSALCLVRCTKLRHRHRE